MSCLLAGPLLPAERARGNPWAVLASCLQSRVRSTCRAETPSRVVPLCRDPLGSWIPPVAEGDQWRTTEVTVHPWDVHCLCRVPLSPPGAGCREAQHKRQRSIRTSTTTISSASIHCGTSRPSLQLRVQANPQGGSLHWRLQSPPNPRPPLPPVQQLLTALCPRPKPTRPSQPRPHRRRESRRGCPSRKFPPQQRPRPPRQHVFPARELQPHIGVPSRLPRHLKLAAQSLRLAVPGPRAEVRGPL